MAREGVAIKCVGGDNAGELGRSVKFQRMLVNRGIRWRCSPPRTPQFNRIAERAIHQLMRIVRSQQVKVGRGEDYWFFAVADAAYKTAGMPHEYLKGETPCERLTRKPFNYNRLRASKSECFMHQHKQQRGAALKFHPYAKRGTLVWHDRHSLCWYVWRMQKFKLMKSSHITFESEANILDIVGELKAVELSDRERETSEEEKTAPINRDDGPGGQPPQDPTSSKCSPSDSKLRRCSRLAQWRRGDNTQQRFRSSDDSKEPSTATEALAGPDADRWKLATDDGIESLWDQGTFTNESLPRDKIPVKTRFVYEIKRTADGAVERCKARLVARGFTQRK
ncbi:unnamed protein product [Sphacelaria rigidula]